MQRQSRLSMFLKILRRQLPLLAERHCVASLEVFGSYVRHEQQADSDLDILVTFSEPPSMLKFIRLEKYLSEILGVKVDLVMKDALKPAIGEFIIREAVAV